MGIGNYNDDFKIIVMNISLQTFLYSKFYNINVKTLLSF